MSSPHQASRTRRRRWRITLVSVLTALAVATGIGVIVADTLDSTDSRAYASEHAPSTDGPSPDQANSSGPSRDLEADAKDAEVWSDAAARIAALGEETRVSAMVITLDTAETLLSVGPDEMYAAASMYKIHTAISLYRSLKLER